MDTWEIVIILALLTISILVISKHRVSTELITILDSPIFQIVVLGLTLTAAVASPAVAVVAITTLVVVYYMRNVVKIQIVAAHARPSHNSKHVPTQVAVLEEKRVITIVNKDDDNNKTMPQPIQNKANADTIENALRENSMRAPTTNHQVIGSSASVNGTLQFPPEPTRSYEVFSDPRGTIRSVESFDTNASFNSQVASSAIDRTIPSEIDSEVFRRGPKNPAAANENTTIAVQMRNYGMSDGQYDINEPRPQTVPGKYEVASYNPDEFIGNNKFIPVGVSLDDKITNMSKGKFVSSAPPPDFDTPVPSKMAQY